MILKRLHLSHLGISKTLQLARSLYFWHGFLKDIEKMVKNCEFCQVHQPRLPKQPARAYNPENLQPGSHVSIDVCHYGSDNYLVTVDRYSGFSWLDNLKKDTSTANIIKKLEGIFFEVGLPTSIRSDNAPNLVSKVFTDWAQELGIKLEQSTPYMPQQNGLVENQVKLLKKLLKATEAVPRDLSIALLEFRNAPRTDGFSPAELFFGRKQRSLLPVLPQNLGFLTNEILQHGGAKRQDAKNAAIDKFNLHASKKLPQLKVGQDVLAFDPNSDTYSIRATVKEILPGSSYLIQLNDFPEVQYRRHRNMLHPVISDPEPETLVHGRARREAAAATGNDLTQQAQPAQPRRSKRLEAKRQP